MKKPKTLYDLHYSKQLTEIRSKLIDLSIKRELTDEDRQSVANLFCEVAEMEKSDLRDDCLMIIKHRLWRM